MLIFKLPGTQWEHVIKNPNAKIELCSSLFATTWSLWSVRCAEIVTKNEKWKKKR